MLKSVPMNTLNEILKPNANSESGSNQTDLEWKKCRKSLLYYLSNYVLVQDSVNQSIIKWQIHPHLRQLTDLVQKWSDTIPRKPLYIVIFKSRQVYTTTTLAGIASWLCTFFESSRVLELSKKETDASEFLGKSKFINDQHPDFLRLKLDPDQSSLIGFPATHSRIRALPSTEDAGRSTDATLVVSDEWEYHPYDRDNFAAVKPTIDKGGMFIGASTIDKRNMDSFPKEIYNGAKSGDNNFIAIFWDYFVVPGRTEETWIQDTKGLADWQKEGEYPRNEAEALSAPSSIGFFNSEIVKEMFKEAEFIKPIETRGNIRIYKRSVADRKYCFTVDPSEGRDDPCAGVIADWATEEDVACFNGKISLDEQAKIAFELWEEYNHPFIAVERNAGGLTLVEKLVNMGVDTWYYCDPQKKKPGWYTNSQNRPVMLNELAASITQRLKRIPMKDALSEFLTFSWIDGKPQKIRGAHDDFVIAHAILGQIRKTAPAGNMTVTSFKYR